MRYSQEFKDNVVARLLSKELSISEAVEQYSIGKSTISYWLRIAREQAGCGTLPNKGNPKLMVSLKLPNRDFARIIFSGNSPRSTPPRRGFSYATASSSQ